MITSFIPKSAYEACRLRVINLGICTTPRVQLAITQLDAVGEVLDNHWNLRKTLAPAIYVVQ